ncbi:alpha/beta hydrolase [bacterium]|nr:alpha/beta hydrolase [bacterium]
MSNNYEKLIKSFDGEEIWYRAIGDGDKTLILADGIACSGYVWKYIIPFFEKKFRIIHLNYRGHGETPIPKNIDSVTVENVVKDFFAVMDYEKIEKGIFLGHSMGVQVILEAFKQQPHRVEGLVPMCGSYGEPMRSYHNTDIFDSIFRWGINNILKPKSEFLSKISFLATFPLIYPVVSRTEVNGYYLKKEDFMPYLESIRDKLDFRSFGYLLESAMNHTAWPILNKIDIPTLIIAGAKDTMTPYFLSVKMHKEIKKSKLWVLPWGSHTAPIEQPQMVNLLIEDFFIENRLL